MEIRIRPAAFDDVPALEALIEDAVMVLQAADYSEAQRRGALGTVFGVDSQLIRDGTYFVAEASGLLVGCGGWSRRRTLFGGDAIAGRVDEELDPARDAARIRAFFVRPDWERRGIGRQILEACEAAALAAGFRRFGLAATLTGVALYAAHGYEAHERYDVPLPNGLTLPVVRMTKAG
ncbi:MAG TPA: GNAT family N-acetyltransferase [Gemmatimonadaceae bacterium]|nr:GNAT family N-acetyltransferase [Gemmatimonadaceae bacterium]